MRFSQFFSLSVSHFFVSLFIFWGTLAHAQNTANPPIQLALIEGMSGPFANTGEAVLRNLVWAVERVNARGGVTTSEGKRLLVLNRYDSKGQSEEALTSLRSAIDAGAQYIFQGNSSANASALIDAIQKHNDREPNKGPLFAKVTALPRRSSRRFHPLACACPTFGALHSSSRRRPFRRMVYDAATILRRFFEVRIL